MNYDDPSFSDDDSGSPPPPQNPLRSGLPIWRWKDNSCALDAVLILLLLTFIEIPFAQESLERLSSIDGEIPRNLLSHKFQAWSAKPWSQWSSTSMSAVRDQVRAYLEVQQTPVPVSEDSEVTVLLNLIPSQLSTTRIERMWEHYVPSCISENDRPSWAPQDNSRFVIQSEHVTCIHLPGEAHQKDDFQNLVDSWVFLPCS
jgi:hypothetical protein